MSMLAETAPVRRGVCPGLSAPMPTGDGLLVRILPTGTIALAALAALCAAASRHGNGIVEITSRGSIQLRGLTPVSAEKFAAEFAALGIAAAEGIPLHCSPLAGLDADEIVDTRAVADDIRNALDARAVPAAIGAKVSVAIDGGGVLTLDTLAADVRLVAEKSESGTAFAVAVGGDATSATSIGTVAARHAGAATVRLLAAIARCGRDARARDAVAAHGSEFFRAALAGLTLPDRAPDCSGPRQARRADPVGTHRLRAGRLACGIGLPFGHTDAATLQRLIELAGAAGADGARTAPGRALIVTGLAAAAIPDFIDGAGSLDFIVDAGDPRRKIFACAGAPICASAYIAARDLAPRIAAAIGPALGAAAAIHISGCAKGCAHAAPAAITVVGSRDGCALVSDGTTADDAFAVVAPAELPAAIARALRDRGLQHV